MRQYFEAKRQYRHALVFFRMGDFYEMFYEDALVASRALDLTLTSRSKDASGTAVPMCGVPFHAADGYIARLVRKGYRVAICEQIEDPKKAKGVVKREVVRVVSPGTLTDVDYLDEREPAFLMAVVGAPLRGPGTHRPSTASRWSMCRPASSTWPSTRGRRGSASLRAEIAVLRPREIVVAAGYDIGGVDSRDRAGVDCRSPKSTAGISSWMPRGRRWSINCASAASRASASSGVRRRCAPAARWCGTCAIPRRPIWRTSARCACARSPMAC